LSEVAISKQSELPATAFDFITAMDVFEHLVDPAGTVDLSSLPEARRVRFMGASPAKSILIGQSTSSRISSRSLIASQNWAFKRSFATTGSGATRYSKKARRPENQDRECGARRKDL
jgi:hypothetical protein